MISASLTRTGLPWRGSWNTGQVQNDFCRGRAAGRITGLTLIWSNRLLVSSLARTRSPKVEPNDSATLNLRGVAGGRQENGCAVSAASWLEHSISAVQSSAAEDCSPSTEKTRYLTRDATAVVSTLNPGCLHREHFRFLYMQLKILYVPVQK